jgi:hypothetical protein
VHTRATLAESEVKVLTPKGARPVFYCEAITGGWAMRELILVLVVVVGLTMSARAGHTTDLRGTIGNRA